MPLGNGPLYVDRTTGEVEPIGSTAYPVEQNLAAYEKRKYGGAAMATDAIFQHEATRLSRWNRRLPVPR